MIFSFVELSYCKHSLAWFNHPKTILKRYADPQTSGFTAGSELFGLYHYNRDVYHYYQDVYHYYKDAFYIVFPYSVPLSVGFGGPKHLS